MIYLFEDRKERMAQYYGSNTVPSGIQNKILDFDVDRLISDEYMDSIFPNAKGVLFHKSYNEDTDSSSTTKIRDSFIDRGLFFVFFSGGIQSANYIPVNGTWEGSVNSRIFYENLDDFSLNKDVRKLCFGEKFKLNEHLNCLRDLNTQLSYPPEDKEDKNILIDKKVIVDILLRYDGSFPEITYIVRKLIDWIEKSDETISVSLFEDQLNKAFQNFLK